MEAEWHALQDEDFSEASIRTILAATRDTSHKVYNGGYKSFANWCSERGQNPVSTSVKHILDFLQLKSKTLAVKTLKGYVTAISRRQSIVRGATLSLDPSIRRWIKDLEHTKGIPHMIMPTWCLELVLVALTKALFEPIRTCHLKYLTWKTVFLLAITSGRRASELHTLCCRPPYIRFSIAGVSLFMKLEFLKKAFIKANASRPIYVPAQYSPSVWFGSHCFIP